RALADPQRREDFDRSALQAREKKVFRVGVADNARTDAQAAPIFADAVEALRTLGHDIVTTTAPFDIPAFNDLGPIDAHRRNISDRAIRNIHALVLPTLTGQVPEVEAARGNPQALSPGFTVFANYFGLPAVSVPCGFDNNGLPVGLQFVGRPWDDA